MYTPLKTTEPTEITRSIRGEKNHTRGITENTMGMLYITEHQRTGIQVQVQQTEPTNDVPNHHQKRNFLNIHPITNIPGNKNDSHPPKR